MAGVRRHVENPIALAGAVLALLGSVALSQLGLARLGGPATQQAMALPLGADALEAALESAPASALAQGDRTVWLVTGVDCEECRALERRLSDEAGRGDLGLRVLLVAQRDQPIAHEEAMAVAALARRGAGAWRDCVDSTRGLHFISDGACRRHFSSDPAEIEGYLEWGRASYDRIGAILAQNGVALAPPALLWLEEDGWRVAMGRRASAPASLAEPAG